MANATQKLCGSSPDSVQGQPVSTVLETTLEHHEFLDQAYVEAVEQMSEEELQEAWKVAALKP